MKNKTEVLYVWEVEYVLKRQPLDAPAWERDTFSAPSFSRAVERAEVEAIASCPSASSPSNQPAPRLREHGANR